MSSQKPAIVLVQSSFQTTLVYEALCTKLQALGYTVALPPLPSCSDVENEDFPTRALIDDAAVITRSVKAFVEGGKTVVVVMHSHGGIVGSEAIPETLSYAARHAKGQAGRKGKTVLETFGESPNNDFKEDGRFFLRNGALTIYSDLAPAVAALWESRLIAQSDAVQTNPVTRAAYEYIPSTYLICEEDQAVPVQIQEMFAGMAKARVERCDAGHSPMLSRLEVLVEKITTAVEGAVAAV
ncbi:Alpha/beta hydrolase fold-1 [Aspergillus karnatakaensis]|uniref:alpha/beta hydrolase n=1 Tax=Aspergillus karnatakaensis TaxID=1810916 RepID=UPI003CCDCCFA